jgi:hypothetical protein
MQNTEGVLVPAVTADLLRILPKNNPNYTEIMDNYKKMRATLLHHHYQATGTQWSQLINDKSNFKI